MTQQVDIDNALDALDSENWETDTVETETARWLFPRYIPTCTTDAAHGMMEQSDTDAADFYCVTAKCKATVTLDAGDMYLSRAGVGYDSDVETVAAWLTAPRNIIGCVLLIGDPGTGKTALIEAACAFLRRPLVTIVATPDDSKGSLFLRFVGEGNGDGGTPYALGPLPEAALTGAVLYVDEAFLLPDGTKPVLYPLADGRHVLPEGNVDGSGLTIHPDFRLVLSANPDVRGASLPEPLASRAAGATLTVETDAAMLRDLGIDDAIVAAWSGLKTAGLWTPQIREMRVANYWLDSNPTLAASALVPEHCPESQRGAVRNVVVSFVGGDLRADGRLVVS